MSYALKVYEVFRGDEEKAKVLAEAFAKLEERYFHVENVATVQDLKNEGLRLEKEIEKVRLEIRETELRLTKEIEKVRLDLTKEIEKVRLEIKETELKLTKEIMESKQSILRWLFGFWITQATFVIGVIWVLLKVQ
ncbi:MAG: DUF1640 domain-containing protein [Nitrospinae bacterium]|nr:DUF1640 domain-containing protein [Nitrospinota bacterium]